MVWWTEISTEELLGLRRRVLQQVEIEFGPTLNAELEDVVQHAFAVLFQFRDRVSAERDGLFRYLKTVARHAAMDRVKFLQHRRNPQLHSSARDTSRASSSTSPVVPPGQLIEENEKIWQVFCALDDLDRLVIWSHVVDGKSIRAVCRELDLNWHRVAAIVEESFRKFRKQLEP